MFTKTVKEKCPSCPVLFLLWLFLRQATGGHGYLKCSRLGELRDNHDAACTYEGDNNVILQQTSNWLINLWTKRQQEEVQSPFGSVLFLKDWKRALKAKTHIESRGAIHQLLNIILQLRTLVLLLVSTLPYVVYVRNYS
jgi:hypothetical protein